MAKSKSEQKREAIMSEGSEAFHFPGDGAFSSVTIHANSQEEALEKLQAIRSDKKSSHVE